MDCDILAAVLVGLVCLRATVKFILISLENEE
mgnify:CR=1 FL=1